MARTNWIFALASILIAAVSAEARIVQVTGKVVEYGSNEAVPYAYVQLLNKCSGEATEAAGGKHTDSQGDFSFAIETELEQVCVWVRTNRYMGIRKAVKVENKPSPNVALGKVFLKPLAAGALNLDGAVKHYQSLADVPDIQREFLAELLSANNSEQIEARYETDPALRLAIDRACRQGDVDCSRLGARDKEKTAPSQPMH